MLLSDICKYKCSNAKVPPWRMHLFAPVFCFVHTIAQFSRILRFSHIYCQIFRIGTHRWRKWRTTALPSTIGSGTLKCGRLTDDGRKVSLKKIEIHVYIYYKCIFFSILIHISVIQFRYLCFLLCAYDSSVLQNCKIFTHLLPNVSHKYPRLTEVTYHCIN
jgi:hypothetical protein